MKKLNRGFTIAEFLLVVVIIGMLAGVGYYMVALNKESVETTVTQTTTPAVQTANTGTTTAHWNTYTGRGYTFQYPDGYTVDATAQNAIEVTSYTRNADGSPAKTDCQATGLTIPVCEVKVSVPLDNSPPTYLPENSDLGNQAQQIINSVRKL